MFFSDAQLFYFQKVFKYRVTPLPLLIDSNGNVTGCFKREH